MHITEIQLYNILREKIGKKEADSIIELIDHKVENEFKSNKENLASKNDIHHLEVRMEKNKSDLVKWMFLFWIGTIGLVFLTKFI